MVQFIHFLKGNKGWRTSVQLPGDEGWAGSYSLPRGIRPEWLVRVAEDHYRTRRPMEFDLGEVTPGKKPGVKFADVMNIRERQVATEDEFAATLAEVDAGTVEAGPAPTVETELV